MSIREEIEQMECENLSPYATLSIYPKGREYPEESCDIRPVFQCDCILYSKAFRRLKKYAIAKFTEYFLPQAWQVDGY